MTDAQWEKLFERVLIKLEEIRCEIIDVEMLLEKKNDNAKMLNELKTEALKAIAEITKQVSAGAIASISEEDKING